MVNVSGSSSRLRPSAGIAIGPILFLIAILVILGLVIATGMRSFVVSTQNEKITQAAVSLLNQLRQYQESYQKVLANGGDPFNNVTWAQASSGYYYIDKTNSHYSALSDPFAVQGGGALFLPNNVLVDSVFSAYQNGSGDGLSGAIPSMLPSGSAVWGETTSGNSEYEFQVFVTFFQKNTPPIANQLCQAFNKLLGNNVQSMFDPSFLTILPRYRGQNIGCESQFAYILFHALLNPNVVCTRGQDSTTLVCA